MNPGCRISRVTPKAGHGGASLIILPTRPKDQEGGLIDRLVELLSAARQGKVRSFALVSRVELPNGDMSWVVGWARSEDDDDMALLLAGIERLRVRVMHRLQEDTVDYWK